MRIAAVLAAATLTASCETGAGNALLSGPAPVAMTAPALAPGMSASPVAPQGWHAVLVAGDSSSPAFDNGIAALRDRLAGRGVRDIELLSAERRGDAVLASPDNIYARLRARAHNREACFVYLTSHGTADGFFLRAGRCLMGPDALDRALTESCGSAPTVVVVSACHSGVFLTARMRRPNRVILTAAAADRSSFGCSADSSYTYYDQCFLRQFDGAATWRDLALGTKSCVEGLERQLGVRQESRPQMFFGDQVVNLKLPGR
jgi:hypothetical protein